MSVAWHPEAGAGGGVWTLVAAGASDGAPPFKDVALRALRLPCATAEDLAARFAGARVAASRGGVGAAGAPAGLEEHLLADRDGAARAARAAFLEALRAAGTALRAAARAAAAAAGGGGDAVAAPPAGEAKEVEDGASQVPFDAASVGAAAGLFNTGGGAEVTHPQLCRFVRLQIA